jgi:hypothetical protein
VRVVSHQIEAISTHRKIGHSASINFELSSRGLEDLKGVLELVSDMKKWGVTGAVVARSFCRRMIQPIKDRVHPAYEY